MHDIAADDMTFTLCYYVMHEKNNEKIKNKEKNFLRIGLGEEYKKFSLKNKKIH